MNKPGWSENNEPIDLASIQVGDELFEVAVLIAGQRDRGIGGDSDGLADIAERLVDGERESGDRFILIKAGDDGALAVARP